MSYWKVYWHGSGPEGGDNIMAVTENGVTCKHEIAYIGDQHHDEAGKIVAAHNEALDALGWKH